MRMSYRGFFCDGLTPLDEDVDVIFAHGQWTIRRSNGSTVYWPMTSLNCEKQAQAVLYTHRQTDATLLIEVKDDPSLQDLPGLEALAKVRGLRKFTLVVILLLAVLTLITLMTLSLRPLAMIMGYDVGFGIP